MFSNNNIGKKFTILKKPKEENIRLLFKKPLSSSQKKNNNYKIIKSYNKINIRQNKTISNIVKAYSNDIKYKYKIIPKKKNSFSEMKNSNKTLNFNESELIINNSKKNLENNLNTIANNKYNDQNNSIKNKYKNNSIDKEFENVFKLKLGKKDRIGKYTKNFESIGNGLNLKQKEKLKKLKNLLFWIERKQKTIGKNNRDIINLEKGKRINFSRAKNINKYVYVPSINYNKNNVYFNKKYELILENISAKPLYSNDNFYSKIKVQSSQRSDRSGRITFDLKNKEDFSKKTISIESPRGEAYRNERMLKSRVKISNNTFYTDDDIPKNKNNVPEVNYEIIKEYKQRCNSSYKSINNSHLNYSKILKEEYSKTIFPLTHKVITESNLINEQISTDRYNEKFLDLFGEEEINQKILKKNKRNIDLNKIRKEFNLYNTKSYINEENVILNGVKRIEKLLTNKKERNLARSVAQKIINEDILSNNYFNYDATYDIRLKQINERKLYSKFAGDTQQSKNKMKIKSKPKTEKQKLFKLLKGGLDNFFNKKSLEYLIFKNRATHLKPGKVLE